MEMHVCINGDRGLRFEYFCRFLRSPWRRESFFPRGWLTHGCDVNGETRTLMSIVLGWRELLCRTRAIEMIEVSPGAVSVICFLYLFYLFILASQRHARMCIKNTEAELTCSGSSWIERA